jgi:hypothetical protein
VAPIEPVAVIGLVGMLLVIVGMVMPWRWPIISAACLFTTNHALALWAMDAPVSISARPASAWPSSACCRPPTFDGARARPPSGPASCASRSLAGSPSPR